MQGFLLLALALFFGKASRNVSASVTLFITGSRCADDYKHYVATQFLDSYDTTTKEKTTPVFVLVNSHVASIPRSGWRVFDVRNDELLRRNATLVIFNDLDNDKMTVDSLDALQASLRTIDPTVTTEFSRTSEYTQRLRDGTAACDLVEHNPSNSQRTIYYCNDAHPRICPSLNYLHSIASSRKRPQPKPPTGSIWPNIFVSAAKNERRHHHHIHNHQRHHHLHHDHHQHHRHGQHLDENVDEIVDQIMEEIKEKGNVPQFEDKPIKEPSETEKKLACKYRKSCYETGIQPNIETPLLDFLRRISSVWVEIKPESAREKGPGEMIYDADEDLAIQKLRCKYRHSCYEQRAIPYDQEAEAKRKIYISSKSVPQKQGKKKTLKEIAAQMLEMVRDAEEKAIKRPLMKVVEKRLNAAEEKRNEKLNCKYRKSCYETGERPVIEDSWMLPLPTNIFSTETAETVSKEVNYDELEELQKKVYCKYRKSCYETGVRPEIEPEIFIQTFKDLTTLHEQVETRKMTLQEKCKYRKSCYETGIVPEINPKLEAAIDKEVSSVMPTNIQDLKLLCKYRKSCYAEIHESATVDTIKFIRKRRQIEKEVRRRKAKRAKLHRRLRGEMQLAGYRLKRHHTAKMEAENVSGEEDDDLKKSWEPLKDNSDESTATRSKPFKSRKQKQRQQSESKDALDESLLLSTKRTTEVEQPQPKKVRKGKKVRLDDLAAENSMQRQEEEAKEDKHVAGSKLEKKKKTRRELLQEEKSGHDLPKDEKYASKANIKYNEHNGKTKKLNGDTQFEEEEASRELLTGHEEATVESTKSANATQPSKHFDTMRKMVEDMHQQQEELQKKEFCKYRKSCYKSLVRPEIDKLPPHLPIISSEQEKEVRSKTTLLPKSETDKKLECKYRKSCYETGLLPQLKITLQQTDEQPIVFKAGLSKQLQCKYRRSCYEQMGLSKEKDELDAIEKREIASTSVGISPKVQSDSDEDDATKRVLLKAREDSVRTAPTINEQKENGDCKPGRSCYTSAESRSLKEDHAGGAARIGLERYKETGWCNQYYYSCRAILGLPPKERAPIGPNGKRLCRKKPL